MHKSFYSLFALAAVAAAQSSVPGAIVSAPGSSVTAGSSSAAPAASTGSAPATSGAPRSSGIPIASNTVPASSGTAGASTSSGKFTVTQGVVLPSDVLPLPAACRTVLGPLFDGSCPGLQAAGFLTMDGNPLSVAALETQFASCVCYTSSTYAASFVDEQLNKCMTQWSGSPLATEAAPAQLSGLCKRVGDVRATQTGSSSSAAAKQTGSTTTLPTESKTGAAASASSTSAANRMKLDWIVMGSASVVAVVGAIAAML